MLQYFEVIVVFDSNENFKIILYVFKKLPENDLFDRS